ncbi:unnamed protein product [Amoebophrya sp. A25]|nr:unnamed protein product [Amoebophrya sp. A25]|eukprot:GSA25T00017240001.1
MKQTQAVGLTSRELAAYSYCVNSVLLLLITYVYEGYTLSGWRDQFYDRLTWKSLGFLLFVAIVINYFANQWQIETVRVLGPTLYSSFQPLRMVSSIFGSHFILNEPVSSWLSWLGIFALCATLSLFFGSQILLRDEDEDDQRGSATREGGRRRSDVERTSEQETTERKFCLESKQEEEPDEIRPTASTTKKTKVVLTPHGFGTMKAVVVEAVPTVEAPEDATSKDEGFSGNKNAPPTHLIGRKMRLAAE